MNQEYKHIQIGWVGVVVIPIVFLLMLYRGIFSHLSHTGDTVDFLLRLIPAAVFIFIMIGMSFMTVTVNRDKVKAKFGIAPFYPSIPLSEIKSVQVVKNPWWMGWGIRFHSNYTLYNVSGLDAIEITKKNGKTIRIGTDEPEVLAQAIQSQMKMG